MGKRAAENQITKDDFEAGKDDAPIDENAEGNFTKAPAEVLKKRRILKVRRTGDTSAQKVEPATENAKNPFSAVASDANVAPKNPFATIATATPAAPKKSFASIDTTTPDATKGTPSKESEATKEPASEEEKQATDAQVVKKDLISENKKDVMEDSKTVEQVEESVVPTAEPKSVEKASDDETKPTTLSPEKSAAETDGKQAKAEDEKKSGVETPEANEKSGTPEKVANGTKASEPIVHKRTPFVFGASTGTTTSFGEKATKESGGFKFSAATLAASAAAVESETKTTTSFAGVSSNSTSAGKTEYEETKVVTGEESETMVFKVRAKVYALEDGKWKERGVGALKLNADEDSGSARLLLRNEATLRSVLNAPLYKNFKFDVAGDRVVRFKCVSSSTMYLCRMRSKDDAEKLIAEVKQQTEKLKE